MESTQTPAEKRIEKNFNNEFLIVFSSRINDMGGYHWLNFTAYEIVAVSDQSMYNKKGYTGSGEWVEKIEEAEVFIQGYLKWDGCTEWEFVDARHFCGWKCAHILSRIIDALYSTAVLEFGFTMENLKITV